MKTQHVIFKWMLLIFAANLKSVKAQEFFVNVNPSTGVHSILDSVPGVKFVKVVPMSSTIDQINNRYFFIGRDLYSQEKLYVLNTVNGKLIKQIPLPAANNTYTNAGNFEFDNSTGNIYCVGFHSVTNDCYFLKMDTSTALISSVSILPQVTQALVGNATYDQTNHRYIFMGQQANALKFIMVSSSTGSVLNTASTGTYIPICIRYNNSTNKLYGINNTVGNIGYLAEWNSTTGAMVNVVMTMSVLTNVINSKQFTSIDEINNRYTYYEGTHLISVDLNNGNIVSSPNFPQGLLFPTENVIELHYNNTTGKYCGLHWKEPTNKVGIPEMDTALNAILLTPNPAQGFAYINFGELHGIYNLQVLNSLGQIVYSVKTESDFQLSINIGNWSKGVYYINIHNAFGVTALRKLVVE